MFISIKEIKFITKNLFLEKTSDSDGFISDFTEPLIKEKNESYTNLFENRSKHFPIYFISSPLPSNQNETKISQEIQVNILY